MPEPYYEDELVTLYNADCREVLQLETSRVSDSDPQRLRECEGLLNLATSMGSEGDWRSFRRMIEAYFNRDEAPTGIRNVSRREIEAMQERMRAGDSPESVASDHELPLAFIQGLAESDTEICESI